MLRFFEKNIHRLRYTMNMQKAGWSSSKMYIGTITLPNHQNKR